MSDPYDERYEWHCSVCGDSVFALREHKKVLNEITRIRNSLGDI